MKKKILFFIFDLGPGGAERVLINLVNQLDLNQYDITVHTLFSHGINEKNLSKKIKLKTVFKCKPFHGISYLLLLFSPNFLHKLFIRDNFDVEIAYLENSPTRIISGCNNKNTKKFAWVHINIDNISNFFRPYRNINEAKKCYYKFDKIAFVSNSTKQSFLKRSKWTTLNSEIVHNTLNINTIKTLSLKNINYRLDTQVINLCTIGRLTKQKGYERLINCLSKLNENGYKRWNLYILGTGELEQNLHKQVKTNNLEKQIKFIGYDVNPYKHLSRMDLYVCSSYNEGYSTAVTESIILGIPVITTNCSGMAEIFGDLHPGIIVNNDENGLYSGLKYIMENPNEIENFKRCAIKRANYFSTEKTIAEFNKFIGCE